MYRKFKIRKYIAGCWHVYVYNSYEYRYQYIECVPTWEDALVMIEYGMTSYYTGRERN